MTDEVNDDTDDLMYELYHTFRFGCCPRCRQIATGCFDCVQSRYGYCKPCKTCWFVEGGMLWSARDLVEQRRVYDEGGFDEYEDVEGFWPQFVSSKPQ